jgi:hypothetical protein
MGLCVEPGIEGMAMIRVNQAQMNELLHSVEVAIATNATELIIDQNRSSFLRNLIQVEIVGGAKPQIALIDRRGRVHDPIFEKR